MKCQNLNNNESTTCSQICGALGPGCSPSTLASWALTAASTPPSLAPPTARLSSVITCSIDLPRVSGKNLRKKAIKTAKKPVKIRNVYCFRTACMGGKQKPIKNVANQLVPTCVKNDKLINLLLFVFI